jgi:hypothetical protein
MGRSKGQQFLRTGPLAAVAAACAVSAATPAISAKGQHGQAAVTCTNPYSGASWQIRIDYDGSTVDTNPAQISDSEISWRDATSGWYYMLDRKSGNLKIILASATGGNFLYDHCKLEN